MSAAAQANSDITFVYIGSGSELLELLGCINNILPDFSGNVVCLIDAGA